MRLQVALIKGGWAAIKSVLEEAKVDPTFAKFASWCRTRGLSLKIVSDGVDRVIHHILKRERIHVDNVWANHLIEHEDGQLELTFPHAPQIVACGSGLCKCKMLASGAPRYIKVVIGDGRSDFCWAAAAELVFAKKALLKHCRETGIKATPYEDFLSVRAQLQELSTEMGILDPTDRPPVPQM